MVRSVSWLTLQPPFATAATSRRANAQMRREFDEMADGFEDALDEVHAKLPGRSKTIKRKMEKCEQLTFAGPIWLALLNHYFLADLDTYKHALQSIPVEHPFEKILLVSESGSVDTLFDRSNPSRT